VSVRRARRKVHSPQVAGLDNYAVSRSGIFVQNTGGQSQPALQRIHPDSTYQSGTAKLALEYWQKQPTGAILRSLAPGGREALRVKPDGRIMNGNTRIKVLQERGFDVNSLPREIVP